MATPCFDVIVVGGGIAGSTLAGVLAQSGLGVLVVERHATWASPLLGRSPRRPHRAATRCVGDDHPGVVMTHVREPADAAFAQPSAGG